MSNPIVTKGTTAKTVDFEFWPQHIGCTLIVSGDLDAETIPITFIGSDGTETDAYDRDEAAMVLSATKPAIPIFSAMKLRIAKPITTNAVGVDLHGIA